MNEPKEERSSEIEDEEAEVEDREVKEFLSGFQQRLGARLRRRLHGRAAVARDLNLGG